MFSTQDSCSSAIQKIQRFETGPKKTTINKHDLEASQGVWRVLCSTFWKGPSGTDPTPGQSRLIPQSYSGSPCAVTCKPPPPRQGARQNSLVVHLALESCCGNAGAVLPLQVW